MKRFPLLLFLLFFPITEAAARDRGLRHLFPNVAEDQRSIWSAPVRGSTWKSPAAWVMVTGSGLAFTLDGEFSRDLRESGRFDSFSRKLDSAPVDLALHGLPLLLVVGGKASGNREWEDYGWRTSEAAVNTLVVTFLLKSVTRRPRPHTGETFGFGRGGNSFPSGHSTLAWATAAVTARHFSDHRWIPWLVYPLAGMVSFSRVTGGHHFTSDAVAGAAIGFAVGRWGTR